MLKPDEFRAAADYLCALKQTGVQLGLQRMERFVADLKHPERTVPCVHIAGTNGKGSVAAMLAAILQSAGWRTGLYTSPHLVRLTERIQVNRVEIDRGRLAHLIAELKNIVQENERQHGASARPSYFEFMTALAFEYFARERCEIAVIETGMGGRLDATNVVQPEVSVITSIGLDHCEVLGETIEQIAREKAGIVKPGRPVVIGRLPAAAEAVVRARAAELEAPFFSVAEAFDSNARDVPPTNLEGAFQRLNAATATLVARVLGERWRIDDAVIRRGLANVEWRGRWQRLKIEGRQVVLDSAHNPEAADSLEANLRQLIADTGRKPAIVIGALGAARAAAIVSAVCGSAAAIYFVEVPHHRRACSVAELRSLVPPGFEGRVEGAELDSLFPAPGRCAISGDQDVVVTGSLYLVGEVLSRLDPQQGAVDSRLQDF
jgi:dihydrofolate synthase / folylpolyglutamate synthase